MDYAQLMAIPREKRSRRMRLFLRGPCCFWCGRVTVYETSKPIRNPLAATVDHLFSQLHPRRREGWNWYVLACYECNLSRAHAEAMKLEFIPRLNSRLGVAREVCAVRARQGYAGLAER
jgi:hypothetical protein